MVIAVDFDGTLDESRWPGFGPPNMQLFEWLKLHQQNGDKVILWSCREGDRLDEAVKYCNEQGLFFDAVNENLDFLVAKYGSDSRKIHADLYIDDKCADRARFGLPYHPGNFSETTASNMASIIAERRKARGRKRQ